jgi:hypothetical protein
MLLQHIILFLHIKFASKVYDILWLTYIVTNIE